MEYCGVNFLGEISGIIYKIENITYFLNTCDGKLILPFIMSVDYINSFYLGTC